MKFNRRSIRLKGYNYSKNGLYYITISTYKDQYLFGFIDNEIMMLNSAGKLVERILFEIDNEFINARVLDYVIMPNHVHFVVEIYKDKDEDKDGVDMESTRTNAVGADSISAHDKDSISAQDKDPPKASLGQIIQMFKRYSTIEYIKNVKNEISPPFYKKVWHRNYYEHIIRNKKDYKRISDYIRDNPKNWKKDRNNYKDG